MVAALPLRWRFYRSGLYISPLAPLLLGMAGGVLTMLLGVGGGFIMVPAMLYLLGMAFLDGQHLAIVPLHIAVAAAGILGQRTR